MHAENLNGFIIIECAGLGWRRRAREDGEGGRPRPRRRSKRPSILPPRVRAYPVGVRACVRSLPPCRASPSLVSITCLLPFLSSSPPRVASERERVGAGRAGARTDLPNDAAAAAALIVVGVVGARPHPTSFLPHIKPRPRSRPQAACVRTCTCPPSSGSSSACPRCTAAPSERTAGRGTASSASP